MTAVQTILEPAYSATLDLPESTHDALQQLFYDAYLTEHLHPSCILLSVDDYCALCVEFHMSLKLSKRCSYALGVTGVAGLYSSVTGQYVAIASSIEQPAKTVKFLFSDLS